VWPAEIFEGSDWWLAGSLGSGVLATACTIEHATSLRPLGLARKLWTPRPGRRGSSVVRQDHSRPGRRRARAGRPDRAESRALQDASVTNS